MENFELTMSKGESVRVTAPLKSCLWRQVFLRMENENLLSIIIPNLNGKHDDVQIKITPVGIQVKTPDSLHLSIDENGFHTLFVHPR